MEITGSRIPGSPTERPKRRPRPKKPRDGVFKQVRFPHSGVFAFSCFSMVGQEGISFAVLLMTAHFGDIVAKVCECLICRGSLTFHEIARFTELPHGQVKNSLLVLIQHNCVQAFSVPKTVGIGGPSRVSTLYMAIFDNIIHRMRFSKFHHIVKKDLGDQCAQLLEGFLQHGRLTFQLLYGRASELSGGKAKQVDVLSMFNKLVHAQYVERCPGVPFLELKSDDEVSSARKRSKSEETKTIEEEAMIAAAPSDADRFSGIIDLMTDSGAVTNDKEEESILEVAAGNKRKHEVLEMDEEIQKTINTNEILWRANYEKFVYCLKKKACVANARSRFGDGAAIVLEALMESCDPNIKNLNFVTSSMNSILEGVRGKPGGVSLTLEHVRAILEQLGCQLCTEETGVLYSIVLKDIIESCKNDEAESLILKKYGKEAYRIFRFLTKTGRFVHTDQIIETTFLEKKEAQKILWKLWMDNYLHMEKLNLHTGGRSEVFLWKVHKELVWQHVLDYMFHAALNISQKISEKEEARQVSVGNAEAEKLRKVRYILEASLLRMDDAIMLFHDFST
ncbi:hypothetical protein HPP92_020192 [Vanilla planifolia]|uniref:DNA-directed RNA polymerase III subunit RPC3 n=1 Tax=Vanilla planifolia TaxID=51239 RepID=A0A835UJV5_VANPL|nr:hypothetical protein HPP92_020192 [Vanilla planifolia]